MTKWISAEQYKSYLQTPTRVDRIQLLRGWRQNNLAVPLLIAKDLFASRISSAELIYLLDATVPESKLEFEFWVFENLLKWPQDLAAAALRAWAQVTDCVLWHRLLPVLRLPGLPQRLHFCILDISPQFAGVDITTTALGCHGWEDYSPAYHGLLFDRAIQYSLDSKRLDVLAAKVLTGAQTSTHPEDKSLQSAVGWLLKIGETKKLMTIAASKPDAAWKHLVVSASARHEERKKDLERAQKLFAKTPTIAKLLDEWPAPWSRLSLTQEQLDPILNLAQNQSYVDLGIILTGCPTSVLSQAFASLSFSGQLNLIHSFRGYIPQMTLHEILEKNSWSNVQNDWLATQAHSELRKERAAMMLSQANIGSTIIKSASDLSPAVNITASVATTTGGPSSVFFAALRGEAVETSGKGQNFWAQLASAWQRPKECDLQSLVTESRKQKGVATICYLMTLGRLAGNDEAVLKTLDHIRTTEEDELRVITTSLGEINTTRSLQELISIITRPNATVSIQQEVVAILSKRDVSALQKEIRATVRDLQIPTDPTSVWLELREALSNLIQTSNTEKAGPALTLREGGIDDKKLDEELGGKIPNYRELSSEVRRALRTALFFNHSIAGSESSHAIDLSPLIDMQYKAMELLFRELFEDAVSQSLQRGDIPRKLDVIGYARPIPQKMDEFEGYIASLPVVREIPFFSKFKLRKMLRAICQFEPGRRFTLDGLKAFGLFFLCFSRRDCRYGLANLFPINMPGDRELAEYAKELHVFQDFRNRAAHEGFHPEASNDIQGIWRTTAFIVQGAFRIRDAIAPNNAAKSIPKAS